MKEADLRDMFKKSLQECL